MPNQSRRRDALILADDLLRNIELGEIGPVDVARRASRLARLLDDAEAIEWLGFEVGGYPDPLTAEASAAARRSNRQAEDDRVWTASLSRLAAEATAAEAQAQGLGGSGSGGQWELAVETRRREERITLLRLIADRRDLIAKIVGAIHGYVGQRYQELRFGSAVESAFEIVRADVDAQIGAAVPTALPMLAAALENAASDNPEHWAAAAATCRRLLKSVADALRPAGPDIEVDGRTIKMGDGNYINRLVNWVAEQGGSATAATMTRAELEFLGRRLDAADAAGQKGAHSTVTRAEASRFITTTYLILGDVLRLRDDDLDGHPADEG
jgi:hypothetical protein